MRVRNKLGRIRESLLAIIWPEIELSKLRQRRYEEMTKASSSGWPKA